MRKSAWFLIFLLCGLSGCESTTSSDQTDTAASQGETSTPGDTDTPDDDAQSDDTGAGDVEPVEPVTDVLNTDTQAAPAGACINGEDLNGLQAKDPRAIVQGCAQKCMSEAGTGCATTCMEDASTLSKACAACFGGIIECLYDRCGTECADGVSPDCDSCTISKGCVADFTACSGISPPK